MKRKFGKIILPFLVLLSVAIILFFIFSPTQAVPIGGTYPERLGSFTGPVGGTEQDDNIKASLDLAHTDLDAMIQNDEDAQTLLKSASSVYYVDSGVDGTTGLTWATALGTLDEVFAIITAASLSDTGVVVFIAPGHTETLGTGADGCDCDVPGVIVYGLGVGENRPLFDYDTATDEFVIGNDDIELHNLQFKSNIDSTVKAIDIEAGCENFVINNCRFYVETTGTDEFDSSIITAAGCDNGRITNCRFEMGAGDAVNAVTCIGSDYLEFSNNIVTGDFSTACFEDKTTASIWPLIDDNTLVNGTVGGTAGLNTIACITMKLDTSCIITDNKCFTNVATPELAIVAAYGLLSGNTYNETEGASGGQLIGTRAGQTYCSVKTATSQSDDLFDVDGGAILITSFTGNVTTAIGAAANSIAINLDADSGWINSDFSTAVETNADLIGTRYVFSSATESVLTPVSDTAGNTNPMTNWYCGEGMIEQTCSGATTGAIVWYMTWIPFNDGTTVTPQS